MAVNKSNPFFSTDFEAYNSDPKWQSENKFNNQQAWDARLYATWEREQVQDWNLDMWNMNNEYNDIGSQIDRARKAGVNPASIVQGDYKSAQSSPVTSQQNNPVQSHAGTGDAERWNAMNGGLGAINDAVNTYIDSQNKEATIALNRDQLNEAIRKNNGELKELASRAGLNDINAKSVENSLKWADGLNMTEIMRRRAIIMDIYNDNYVAFQRLAIDAKESGSRVRVNEANANYQEIANKYADQKLKAEASIEDFREYEQYLRYIIAKELQIPLGSSVFEFNYAMIRNGMWFDYVDVGLRTLTDASLKPTDRVVNLENEIELDGEVAADAFGLDFGVDVGGQYKVKGTQVTPRYEPPTDSRTVVNPIPRLRVVPRDNSKTRNKRVRELQGSSALGTLVTRWFNR